MWIGEMMATMMSTSRPSCWLHQYIYPIAICLFLTLAALSQNVFQRKLSTKWPRCPVCAQSSDISAAESSLSNPASLADYGSLCNMTIMGEKQTWNQHKKVIAFSVYTSSSDQEELDPWILNGITIQTQSAKRYYPDWIIRIYSVGLSQEIQENLIANDNVELVECARQGTTRIHHWRNAMLRFLVVDDPTVRYSIIRDVDSRFSVRELMAVNEWMASGLEFHAMRDHLYHSAAIMAGMFGMKRGLFDNLGNTTTTKNMTRLIQDAFDENPHRIGGRHKGDDQKFLQRYLWEFVRDRAMVHDILPERNEFSPAKETRYFPLGPRNEEENYFVGSSFKGARVGGSQPWFRTDFVDWNCTLQCKI